MIPCVMFMIGLAGVFFFGPAIGELFSGSDGDYDTPEFKAKYRSNGKQISKGD